MTKTEAAKFISWNDGFTAARNGIPLKSTDADYVAGYRYFQHINSEG